MKSISVLYYRSPCDERLLNEAIEAAGYDSPSDYRKNFDPDRRAPAIVGALVLDASWASRIYKKGALGAVWVGIRAYDEVTIEMLEHVESIVMGKIANEDS